MDTKDIRAAMEAILDSLDYDFRQFSMDGFARWPEDHRDRAIRFVPLPLPTQLLGAWIAGSARDFVFYESNTPPVHQSHNQLHELAHVICHHTPLHLEPHETRALLSGADGPSAEASAILCRSRYDSEAERESKTLTALIQERIIRHSRLEALTSAVPLDERFASYIEAMEV